MTLDLSSNHRALRGFHGNYEVTVLKNGEKVAKKSFALPKSRKTIDIHLHITEGNIHIIQYLIKNIAEIW